MNVGLFIILLLILGPAALAVLVIGGLEAFRVWRETVRREQQELLGARPELWRGYKSKAVAMKKRRTR